MFVMTVMDGRDYIYSSAGGVHFMQVVVMCQCVLGFLCLCVFACACVCFKSPPSGFDVMK